jgi:formiminotetrahydrofolate cyclodeaminase
MTEPRYTDEQRIADLIAENARLREALSELIEGIDRWNEAVAQIVDVSHLPKWQGLEAARTALKKGMLDG